MPCVRENSGRALRDVSSTSALRTTQWEATAAHRGLHAHPQHAKAQSNRRTRPHPSPSCAFLRPCLHLLVQKSTQTRCSHLCRNHAPRSPRMEPPAVQQATGDSPLEAFVSSASTIALYAALEGSSRRALTRTSVKCRAWVFELAEQTTITLRAHGGLQEDAWSKRVSHAEAVLSQRAIFKHSTDKLRVSLPTPNPDALQSILSLTDPARHAVAHLEITQSASREYAEEGLHTPTLQLLPQAFPALRSLRINRLFGCLPPTELLAGLKELHVQIRAR